MAKRVVASAGSKSWPVRRTRLAFKANVHIINHCHKLMKTLEISETDLNQLISQTKIVDEIVLVSGGRQIARLLPPKPNAPLIEQRSDPVSTVSAQPPTFFATTAGDAMEQEIAAHAARHKELVRDYLGQNIDSCGLCR